uniref:Phosphopantetheine-binding protein n=1 Tax=Desertifilum tharense IPPAS B-1220 TaxID=1781255 RepID=A0ACD5H1Z7_9CYAN
MLKVAIQHYFNKFSPASLAELQQLEENCDLTVWKVATWIYQESGHPADFSRVRDIIQARIPNIKSRLLAEQKRKEEAEARRRLEQQRQAEAKAEAQRILEQKQREEAEKAHRLLEQKRQEELEAQRILEPKRKEKAEAQRLLEEKRLQEEERQRLLIKQRQEEEEAEARRILEEKQRKEAEIKVRVAPLLDQFQGNEKKATVFFKVRQIVAKYLDLDDEDINTSFEIEDNEGLDTVYIFEDVEEEFELEIPDEEVDQKLGRYWQLGFSFDNLLNLVYEQLGDEYFQYEEAEKPGVVLDEKQQQEAEFRAKKISLLEQLEGNQKKFDLFLELQQIIGEEGGIEQEDIQLNAHLSHDLGFDDEGASRLIVTIEELFKVEVFSDDLKQLGIYWARGWTFSSEPSDNNDHQGELCLVRELLDWLYSRVEA